MTLKERAEKVELATNEFYKYYDLVQKDRGFGNVQENVRQATEIIKRVSKKYGVKSKALYRITGIGVKRKIKNV